MELGSLVEGVFEERLNRFVAMVDVDGRSAMVHVANSGRMRELLRKDARCLLAPRAAEGRKTAYDLALVEVASDRAVGETRQEYDGTTSGRVLVSAEHGCPRRCCGRLSAKGGCPPSPTSTRAGGRWSTATAAWTCSSRVRTERATLR